MTLAVYDVAGRRLRVLVDGARPPGTHRVVWVGRDDAGRDVASGVYLAQLRAGAGQQVRRLVRVR